MGWRRAFGFAVLVLVVGAPLRAIAQGRAARMASQSRAEQARVALADGQFDTAVELADALLKNSPASRDAAAIKIAALVGKKQQSAAFSTYETWIQSSRREDVTLLEPIARDELHKLRLTPQSIVQGGAMEALALAGDVDARAALDTAFRSSTPTVLTWDATEGLARMKESAAERRVLDAAEHATGGARVRALQALKSLPHLSGHFEEVLRPALAGDVVLQVAAADVAGTMGVKRLTPDLERALPGAAPFARVWIASALRRLGSPTGAEVLSEALAGSAVDVKLIAAHALKASGQHGWKEAVRPLLEAPEQIHRLDAAELFFDEEREKALEVLKKGLEDPNHVVRGEAGRILTSVNAKDVWVLRWMLRDGAPFVRFLAAKTVLAQCAPAKK